MAIEQDNMMGILTVGIGMAIITGFMIGIISTCSLRRALLFAGVCLIVIIRLCSNLLSYLALLTGWCLILRDSLSQLIFLVIAAPWTVVAVAVKVVGVSIARFYRVSRIFRECGMSGFLSSL